MPIIWIVGFRGTGKTSVGRALAARTGLRFVDTDDRIQDVEQMTVAEIFERKGEPHFRIAEQQVILQLATEGKNLVVAAGGGACGHESNVVAMRQSGTVVLLTASSDEIEKRLADDSATADQRPALTDQPSTRDEIVFLLNEREPDYRKAAHIVIDTTYIPVEQAVASILKELRKRRHR